MHTPKRYIHDRLILALLTANCFFAALTSVLISLRLDSARGDGYIIQYRPSLGLSAYQKGSGINLMGFAVFAVFVLAFHIVLSVKVYGIRRQFSVVILGMALLLIVMSLVISNALLLLH